MDKWIPCAVPSALSKSEVQIWQVDLSSQTSNLAHYISLLNQDEIARKNRFKFVKDQENFAITRGVLRTLLGSFLALEPSRVAFKYTAHGKPKCATDSAIHFNVSHTQNKAVFAFTLEAAVGIDIESITTRPTQQLANRFFAKEEVKALSLLSQTEQQHAFYRIWTQKEAYIKAIGLGLSQSLDSFVVSVTPPAKIISIDNSIDQAGPWSMHSFTLGDAFIGHLAIKKRALTIGYYRFV